MPLSGIDRSQTTAIPSLEEALDQLSVRMMVEGVGPNVVADLRQLAAQIHERQSPAVAERVIVLAQTLSDKSRNNVDEILKTGISEVRLMIKNEKAGLPASSAPAYASLGEDAELIADFLVEAREHLSLIEGQLLSLERDPSALEDIHAVFRAFHTIKGLAGFLGFSAIQAVAHEVETLLDLARNDKVRIDTPIVDVVLASSDYLLGEMASIDRVLGGAASVDPLDNGALIVRIRTLAVTSEIAMNVPASVELPVTREFPSTPVREPKSRKPTARRRTKSLSPKEVNSELNAADSEYTAIATSGTNAASLDQEEDDFFTVTSTLVAPSPDVIAPPLASFSTAPGQMPPITEKVKWMPVGERARPAESAKTPDVGSVRVETAKLDYLMDMVGEMVIAQSLIRHSQVLLSSTDSRLIGDLSHLARVTAEVQRATMSMRMVPVAHLFQKIERVIRDLSRKAGKQVALQTSGADTEVDKTVSEELSDPLLHMVRNSVDHGIEPPEERLAAGKSAVATIKLAAYHQGGQVVIQISDDGRGLNAEKIRAKAEQKRIILPGLQLSEAEIYQLIFAPGFSTAEKITDVSGRGVGMDVVRRNVEKLRGRIETQSELGHGTTFLLKLPLTLAIIDGLVIEVGKNHYIVPLSVVREIFRPMSTALFSVEGREEMVLVREQLLPIVRLNQRLGIKSRVHLPSEGLLVVVESENKLYCMLVDDLLGKQEVVIKSLGETFQEASGFSGCAVLGDGRIGLILDTDGIYRGSRR